MSAFVLVGIFTGILITILLKDKSPGYAINAAVGVLGAFVGLFIKDIADIQVIGNLAGAFIFSFMGAFVALAIANLIYLKLFRN